MNGFRQTDTIIAPATIPGTGAVSLIRISGPDAFSLTDSLVELKRGTASQANGYSAHFGSIYSDGNLLDEVIVTVFRAPASYTGEDMVEISCHASSFICSEIIRLFQNAGARIADPGEFTQRAFLNGKMDLAQAEAVADVISSTTSASHRVSVSQLKGGVSKELAGIRADLLEITSLLELELDFSEEDVEFADRNKLEDMLRKGMGHISSLVDTYRKGNAIRNGIPVAIVGEVNAGKSSLLNLLVKDDRAIVSDIPGTTRDTVEETSVIDGLLYRFIDTAGLRDTEDEVERMGIERSNRKISEADTVILVLDSTKGEFDLLNNFEQVASKLDLSSQSLIILLNKTDICPNSAHNKNVLVNNKRVLLSGKKIVIIPFSAKTSEGLEELEKQLSAFHTDLAESVNSTLITNLRHREALSETLVHMGDALTSLSSGLTGDLVAEHLRFAISSLGRITGDTITPDEVMGNIFSHFCIGK